MSFTKNDWARYPLAIFYIVFEMAIEIVSFPISSMVFLPSYVNVYQGVLLLLLITIYQRCNSIQLQLYLSSCLYLNVYIYIQLYRISRYQNSHGMIVIQDWIYWRQNRDERGCDRMTTELILAMQSWIVVSRQSAWSQRKWLILTTMYIPVQYAPNP